MKHLKQLDNPALSALKTALDGLQQFESNHAESARYFRKIVEYLIGPLDGIDPWAIRELIHDEDNRRNRPSTLTISSAATYDRIRQLGPQELRVLKLIAEGYQSDKVANLLDISYRTVANHRARLVTKLGLSTARELVRFAITNLEFI